MYSKSISALSLSYTNKKEAKSLSPCILNSGNSELLPDLSHLSEEERQIIASVLERQRAEELGFSTEANGLAFASSFFFFKLTLDSPLLVRACFRLICLSTFFLLLLLVQPILEIY